MTEIITRNTKSAELTYQEGDNQIAAPARTTAVNLTLNATHNREIVVFNGASLVATLTAAATLEPALNVTGGGDTVGYVVTMYNLNATELKITSATNIDGSSADIFLPQYAAITIAYDPVSNQYVAVNRPNAVFVTDSEVPLINSTLIEIIADGHIELAWESYGPTLNADGSAGSADHIWTALDDVPYDVDWIELKFRVDATATTATDLGMQVWVRPVGSSATRGALTSAGGMFVSGLSGSAQRINTQGINKVMVDTDDKFEVAWASSGDTPDTNAINMMLVGYGWNR